MDNIRVHFIVQGTIMIDKVVPGWAVPRLGESVSFNDTRRYKVDAVWIQYQSGLGDALNPVLVEAHIR